MALTSGTVFEIRSTATSGNVNGGGFNPTNTSMMTDLTTDSNTANTNSPVCSSGTYNFTATDVGHWLYIKSGTNWTPGWYQIVSVANNKATLSAAIGQAIQTDGSVAHYKPNTVAGCATVGTPTSGTFTIDYSQKDASPFASTDIAVVTTTTLTSASNPFTKAMVGNIIHITAGTATAGWYEIKSVAVVTATIDRSATTTGINNTGKVGGALSLGSSDDAVFELAIAGSGVVPSTRYFIQSGTYTLGGAVSIAANGANDQKTKWTGYQTLRGDSPAYANWPVFDCGSNTFTTNTLTEFSNIKFIGSAAPVFGGTYGGQMINCSFINTSTTAGRDACNIAAGGYPIFLGCEFRSLRGQGVSCDAASASSGGPVSFTNCTFSDSDVGLKITTVDGVSSTPRVLNCLFVNNVTHNIQHSGGTATHNTIIQGNTFYGAENKLGTGILFLTADRFGAVWNNIFYGLVTGVNNPDTGTNRTSDYNNYFNNTNDVNDNTKWMKGPHDLAVDPSFSSVTQRTGSTATTTAGNHLVQPGATFVTWGVAVGDVIHVKSGTGPTAGLYTILTVDSETQITTNETLAADATGDKVWQITTGRNFAVGTSMKALGYPSAFPGKVSTSNYIDIGAIQRQEPAAGGGGTPILQSGIIQGLGVV